MPDASNLQTSFLGGEWSQTAQGRQDDPRYKTGMNICLNGFPLEEGAWVRRPGFGLAGNTNLGHQTYLFPFNYTEGAPYTVEVDVGVTRLWNGTNHVFDSSFQVYAIYNTTPMTISIDPASGYNTGDVINILVTSGPNGSLAEVQNRDFYLTKVTTGIYTLADPITGVAVPGSISNWNGTTMTANAARVLVLSNPYLNASDLPLVNACQAGAFLLLFHPNYETYSYGIASLDTADQRFSTFFGQAFTYADGPYYPAVFGQTATPSGQSGSITLTFTGGFGLRSSAQSSDIGKSVRLLSEPLLWVAGTTYTVGQQVLFPAGTGSGPGNYYLSLQSLNTGNTPSTSPNWWAINPELANWVYGTITAINAGNQVTVSLNNPLFYANPVNFWQLGLFGGVDGWPTAGAIHEGRLYPVYLNYVLASAPYAFAGSYDNFSPTLVDGTVIDASAINYVLQSGSETSNQNFWAETGPQGLMIGGAAGEYLVQASSLNDPITPTSIQVHRVTKYGCANVQPAHTGFTVMFVQRFAQRVLEMISDVFTGKFAAPNLTLRARHIGRPGFLQIGWCETPNPILWTRDKLGTLAGVVYRRLSSFISEEPNFVGWHRHLLGASSGGNQNRSVNSLAVSPSADGTYDSLSIVSQAWAGSTYVVQAMQRQFTEGDPLDSSYFLDDARAPTAIVDTSGTGVVLSGFFPLVGAVVTAFIAGLNCGTYTVDSTGSITVPYGSDPDGLFTQAYLASYPSAGQPGMQTEFAKVVTTPPASYSATPASIGEYAASTASTTVVFADWANNVFYFCDATVGHIKTFNITTRSSIASVAISSIGAGAGVNFLGVTSGYIYVQDNGDSHGAIYKLDSATLTPTLVIGTTQNGSPPPYFTAYVLGSTNSPPGQSAIVAAGNNQFLVGQETVDAAKTVQVYDLTVPAYANFNLASTLPKVTMCAGASGQVGSVFMATVATQATQDFYQLSIGQTANTLIITYPAWSVGPYAPNSIVTYMGGLYQASSPVTNQTPGNSPWVTYTAPSTQGGISLISGGTLAASAVDAGWSTFAIQDMGYDQTDGNLILFVAKGSGTGAAAYLIKVNPYGSIPLWKVSTPGLSSCSGLALSNINTGVLGFFDTSGNYYAINTSTGATNISFTIAGAAITPSAMEQLFNGTSNTLYTRYAYNSGTTGAPTPLSGTSSTFTDWAVYIPFTAFNPIAVSITSQSVPALVGLGFTSQGQRLRPGTPPEAGSANGPPQAKTRRSHMYGMLVNNTPGYNLQIGTSFGSMYPVIFKSPGQTPYLYSQAFTGVKWDVLSDPYSFDSMACWQVTGPYPCTMASFGSFLHTQDR